MTDATIFELNLESKLDEDIIDKNNIKSLFNYDIFKTGKYAKGDNILYPDGTPNWGNTIRFTIQKKGDLLYGIYLIVKLPKLSIENLNVPEKQNENDSTSVYRVKYVDYIGNVLVEKASLYINGQLIDEQYGDYMQLYIDLYMSDINRKMMLGLDDNFNKPNLKIDSEYIYIPLKYWFCNDNIHPLPIIALQYSDIYIDIKFREFSKCVVILEYDNNKLLCHTDYEHRTISLDDVHMQTNFYYLCNKDREIFSQKEYEILITQSQYKYINCNLYSSLDINFNNIVKDLIFFIQPEENIKYGEYFNFSSKMEYLPKELFNKNIDINLWKLEPKRHILNTARILFNGLEKISWRNYKYFYFMQNHENYKTNVKHYFYMYSFNINPSKNTNNNGCNFSRIDTPQLQVKLYNDEIVLNKENTIKYSLKSNYILKCFATNYNIFVIKNGLGSLKYYN
jgi:hypothetical protein